MVLTADILGMLAFTLVAFWGVASWALVRTMRQESRKIELLEGQDRIDTYSPTALAELREWIQNNPDDPLVDDARRRHNECVETLEGTDRRFYDWSDEEVERLERI
ncbi:hypothetical protein [Natronococcus jeotgali]|uniref:Uncharacterized protein n=1 Tax=Natronococcus jeotgali DSM 18795 TaxID=1227498 RepID=L9XU55_9EURY|nr:hypothetical protein [Natronococcus jeotgali]ELY65062.1 hypothetical protein C492_04213 [Natronococcus jeotgali DSM 18795]